MAANQTVLVRYIFVDIVGFTQGRSVESQVRILEVLNRSVRQSVAAVEVDQSQIIYLPTGDGVCICLIDPTAPPDCDVRIAIMLMEIVHSLWLAETVQENRFKIRIGLNENQDNMVMDIGGFRRNFIGNGINHAHRLVSLAAPFQILVGPGVYQRLHQRKLHRSHLHAVHGIVKHGEKVLCYCYHDPSLACFASAGKTTGTKEKSSTPQELKDSSRLPL